MLALMVSLYLAAAALLLAWLVFPGWRAQVRTALRHGATRAVCWPGRVAHRVAHSGMRAASVVTHGGHGAERAEHARTHRPQQRAHERWERREALQQLCTPLARHEVLAALVVEEGPLRQH